jgi:hypothetical protein
LTRSLSILPFAAPSHAELLKWDAKKATAAASELLKAAEGLQGALRRQPPRP